MCMSVCVCFKVTEFFFFVLSHVTGIEQDKLIKSWSKSSSQVCPSLIGGCYGLINR